MINEILTSSQCLLKDPKQRLGSVGDIEEIQAHPWFDDFDWGALLRKEVKLSKENIRLNLLASCSI